MKSSLQSWQILVIVVLGLMNIYAISQGLKYSAAGVLLALASLITLLFCVRIFRKLNEAREQESE